MAQSQAKKRTRFLGWSAPLPMADARKRLPKLADALEKHPEIGAVKITRRGKPVLAVLSWSLFESAVETMEIKSDPETMAAFRQGVKGGGEGDSARTTEARVGALILRAGILRGGEIDQAGFALNLKYGNLYREGGLCLLPMC